MAALYCHKAFKRIHSETLTWCRWSHISGGFNFFIILNMRLSSSDMLNNLFLAQRHASNSPIFSHVVCSLLRFFLFPLILSHTRVNILPQLIQYKNEYPFGFCSDLKMMSGKRVAHRGPLLPRLAHSSDTLVHSSYFKSSLLQQLSFSSFSLFYWSESRLLLTICITRDGMILTYLALTKASWSGNMLSWIQLIFSLRWYYQLITYLVG